MDINQIILDCLQTKGLMQKELALFLGVAPNSLNNWLKKGTDIPNRLLIPICKFLNISLEYLLTGVETPMEIATPVLNKNENEQELLSAFRKLSDRNQLKAIGKVEDVLSTQQEAEQTKENVG